MSGLASGDEQLFSMDDDEMTSELDMLLGVAPAEIIITELQPQLPSVPVLSAVKRPRNVNEDDRLIVLET